MSNTAIHICITIDQTYFDLAKICVNEIIQTRNKDTELYFYILGNNTDVEIFNRFSEVPRVHVVTYSVNFTERYHLKYETRRYLTTTMYVRMFIPILPMFKDVDKVLYLDPDILARADLSGFYNEDLTGKALGVVKDFGLANVYNERPVDLSTYEYFNSGQLLMNLPYLREMGFTTKCVAHLCKNENKSDQDIINDVVKGHVKFLSPIYFYSWHKVKFNKKYGDINLWNKTFGTHFESIKELEQQSVLWHFHGDKKELLNDEEIRSMYEFRKRKVDLLLGTCKK